MPYYLLTAIKMTTIKYLKIVSAALGGKRRCRFLSLRLRTKIHILLKVVIGPDLDLNKDEVGWWS